MRKKLSAEEFFERFDQAFEFEKRMVEAKHASDKLIGEVGVRNIGADINLAVIALSTSNPFLIEKYRPRIESDDFLGALRPGLADLLIEFGQARDSFNRISFASHIDTAGGQATLRALDPASSGIVSFKDGDRKKKGHDMQSVSGVVLGMYMDTLSPECKSHLYVHHGGWISANRTASTRVVKVVEQPDGSLILEPTVDIRFHD